MRQITGLSDEILREIGTLSRTIHSKCDLKYKEYDLQKGQFIFLTRICEHPGINQIQLSNTLRVDKTTTAKAIQKLIGGGYLRKSKDDADNRAFRLYPTAKAQQVYDMLIAEENVNIDLCFQGFNPAEKTQALDLVRRMNANLEFVWHDLKKSKRSDDNDSQRAIE